MHRTIIAVGDSHSLRCFENHPVIADSTAATGINKLDGKTAYKLQDHDRRVRKVIAPLHDKHIIFCFGEVDVRIHLKRQHGKTGTDIATLIENTAKRYTGYVAKLRQQGFDIHIFNVVPTGDFHGDAFEKWRANLAYPPTTSFTERRDYTLQLNEQYRKYCAAADLPFIDIYKHLIDAHGLRHRELVYDFSHLNSTTADIVLRHYSFSPS
jgi:lysophospholipase L1-like esterase